MASNEMPFFSMVVVTYTNKLPSVLSIRQVLAMDDGDPEKEWRVHSEEYSEDRKRKGAVQERCMHSKSHAT